MLRPTLRILSALLVLSALACVSPTAPSPARANAISAPATGASFDDITPVDTTCRTDYNVGQGKTC
jgi:hypothetical protein